MKEGGGRRGSQRSTVNGQRSTVNGQRSTIDGQRATGNGRRGQRSTEGARDVLSAGAADEGPAMVGVGEGDP